MYRPRPLNDSKLECDICGKPAKWRDREFHSSYVLGEALCDGCEKKFTFTSTEFENLLDKASQPLEQPQKPDSKEVGTSESLTSGDQSVNKVIKKGLRMG